MPSSAPPPHGIIAAVLVRTVGERTRGNRFFRCYSAHLHSDEPGMGMNSVHPHGVRVCSSKKHFPSFCGSHMVGPRMSTVASILCGGRADKGTCRLLTIHGVIFYLFSLLDSKIAISTLYGTTAPNEGKKNSEGDACPSLTDLSPHELWSLSNISI